MTLELAVDRPLALCAVRLCDVSPTGESLLVTRCFLNLTHRGGHERPEPLVPGRRSVVTFRLDGIAHRFQPGHRLRVAASPTYWPLAWPSPEPVTLTVYAGGESRLDLPVRPERAADASLRIPEPEEPALYPTVTVRPGKGGRVIEHDLDDGRAELRFDWDMGGLVRMEPSGIEHEDNAFASYSIAEGDPLSASVECVNGFVLRRGEGWDTSGETRARMTSTRTHFHVTAQLETFEGRTRVWGRNWVFTIPRDLV